MTDHADTLSISLSDATGVPFYRQIEDQLASLIRSGRLAPGTALPSVRALAAKLLVSVITTRRVYDDLEREGLVESRQGQGTFVAAEVERASQRKARADARDALAQAVLRARQLGLADEEIRSQLQTILSKKNGGANGPRAD
jgi:GntR family transcriptional regulator